MTPFPRDILFRSNAPGFGPATKPPSVLIEPGTYFLRVYTGKENADHQLIALYDGLTDFVVSSFLMFSSPHTPSGAFFATFCNKSNQKKSTNKIKKSHGDK